MFNKLIEHWVKKDKYVEICRIKCILYQTRYTIQQYKYIYKLLTHTSYKFYLMLKEDNKESK